MKRPALLAWPLIICYFLLALVVVAKDSSETDKIRLRVSIRKDALKGVPSCQHTFSQIELLNLHASDPIQIRSIQTVTEQTVLTKSKRNELGRVWENIPQQFHVSRLPHNQLNLGPGQVAIVPVTFLPRYPELPIENGASYDLERRSPPLSSTTRADLVNIVGRKVVDVVENFGTLFDPLSPSSISRNNVNASTMDDVYEVSTNVVVETTRGTLRLPIVASSVRQNAYNIPDVIRFHHSIFPSPPAKDHVEGGQEGVGPESSSTASVGTNGVVLLSTMQVNDNMPTIPKYSEPMRDCFDLHLSNPSPDRDLQVSEVLVTKPEVMSVEFNRGRRPLPTSPRVPASIGPAQVVRDWTEEGPLFLPPLAKDVFIATVCTAPNGVERDESTAIYLEEMSSWIDSGSAERGFGFVQLRTDAETLFVALESQEETNDLVSVPANKLSEPIDKSGVLLKSVPESLDIRMTSSGSQRVDAPIGMQNKSPFPIRIMRVAIGMDTPSNEQYLEQAEILGLQLNVSTGNAGFGSARATELDTYILPAAGTVENAFTLTCRVEADASMISSREHAFEFSGAIVFRGTMDTEISSSDWINDLARDPHREVHLTLEVPYTVSILNGRIEVSIAKSTHPFPQIIGLQPWDRTGTIVGALFFPASQLEALDGSEKPLPTQKYVGSRSIVHKLHVMTNVAPPIEVQSIRIEQELQHAESGSLCDRFNATISDRAETTSARRGFSTLGLLTLRYSFGGQSKGKHQTDMPRPGSDFMIPTTCYLNIATSSNDTEVHRIPLVIFPGQLEVSSSSSHSSNMGLSIPTGMANETPQEGESVVMGYEKVLSWLRSSTVGRAFLHLLERQMQNKANQSDSHLLEAYLMTLYQGAGETMDFKPILLNVGAVEHGDVVRAPLFFTNHNPIPIALTVEVGEVEGMQISLGRDGSHVRGDGSTIVDYLPREPPSLAEGTLVLQGKHGGHPLNGLRQFLLSNDEALEFSSRFPCRDAVSLNKAAVSKQPFLHHLYKWYSIATFHRDEATASYGRSSSTCDISLSPPPHQSLNSSYVSQGQGGPGAILVSGDEGLAATVPFCSHSESEAPKLGGVDRIQIPPGGTARFELLVRAPPQSYLQSDISQMLATGLVLSTNFGEAIPILTTFEALQGQLHLSKNHSIPSNATEESTDEQHRSTIIDVPVDLSWQNPSSGGDTSMIPKAPRGRHHIPSCTSERSRRGVPLSLSSSFSRDVRLLRVESCNPLFEVVLRDAENGVALEKDKGTSVGSLYSVLPCLSETDDVLPTFPSFYQCALNWLANRSEFQQAGCGAYPVVQQRKLDDGIDTSHRGIRSVIEAFENALVFLHTDGVGSQRQRLRDNNQTTEGKGVSGSTSIAIKSGRRRTNGFISPDTIRVFAEAWEAWRVAADFGFTTLTSNLRTFIEYGAQSDVGRRLEGQGQSLSLAMRDVTIESVLSQPTLLDQQRAQSSSQQPQQASVLEFPPSLVGTVVARSIPLHNPTAVPVRVRLAAAFPDHEQGDVASDDSVRGRYLQRLPAPYVQNGLLEDNESESAKHIWWDGWGAFFVSDERGNVIRSHHNITIRAGAGAHVSLVNPSLHSSVSFLVGCGARCGVRDDPSPSESSSEPQLTSIIGAAAAAGISLSGRQRPTTPQANSQLIEEPYILSGGAPFSRDSGPAAFAIPYSALDEIVIPPFGVGEIGPILFRPPGRSNVLGCDLARESGASHWGVRTEEFCDTADFEAMVFLENSLTGLERVELRGKGLWENLYFVDAPQADDDPGFGDLEFRNGRPTLMFSGSGDAMDQASGWTWQTRFRPEAREVVLHNGGDVAVDIAAVYLADTSKLQDKRWPSQGVSSEACRHGSFILWDCLESNQKHFEEDGALVSNVHAGFKLAPGRNRSMYVVQVSDCSKQEEFVSLNVDYRREDEIPGTSPMAGNSDYLTSSDESTRHGSKNVKGAFSKKKIELIVGYSMSPEEMLLCSPVTARERNPTTTDVFFVTNTHGDKVAVTSFLRRFVTLLWCALALAVGSMVLAYFYKVRSQASDSAWLKPRTQQKSLLKQPEKRRVGQHSLWNAAFRCLARADPSPLELQTLGKEQIRQVVLGRYRAKGVVPPPPSLSSGSFTRDRSNAFGGSAPRHTGKEGGSGAERARTLSDALFQAHVGEDGVSAHRILPAGLGWRVAYARGIIDENSIRSCKVPLATRKLLEDRHKTDASDLVSVETEGEPEDVETDAEEGSDELTQSGSREEPEVEPVALEEEAVSAFEIKPPVASDAVPEVEEADDDDGWQEVAENKSIPSVDDPVEVEKPTPVESKKAPLSTERMTSAIPKSRSRNSRRNSNNGATPAKKEIPTVHSLSTSVHSSGSVSASGSSARGATISTRKAQQQAAKEKVKTQGNRKGRGGKTTNDSVTKPGNETSIKKQKPSKTDRTKIATKPATRESPTDSATKKARSKPANERKTRTKPGTEKKANAVPKGRGAKTQKPSKEAVGTIEPVLATGLPPPPGLAPPPGFTQDDPQGDISSPSANLPLPLSGNNAESTLGELLNAALNSDLNIAGTSPSASLPFTPSPAASSGLVFPGSNLDSTQDENVTTPADGADLAFSMQSSPPLPSGQSAEGMESLHRDEQHTPRADPLQNMFLNSHNSSQNGFDVMDFLDNILKDGVSQQEGEPLEGGGLLAGPPPEGPVMSNPWATGTMSRAAAYGISFDDADATGGGTETAVHYGRAVTPSNTAGLGNIPLLTPAAILMSGQEDDELDADDSALSFYASLTEE